ncbi:MAG: hypothetical protein KatS3mg111_3859 [Pirellulaceae bacterium]|nr:MAG: hypothetical protein KatS3mg111_3859 [Pirellulaceae bacterium]
MQKPRQDTVAGLEDNVQAGTILMFMLLILLRAAEELIRERKKVDEFQQ